MVTLQILVLPFLVRVRIPQHSRKRFWQQVGTSFFIYMFLYIIIHVWWYSYSCLMIFLFMFDDILIHVWLYILVNAYGTQRSPRHFKAWKCKKNVHIVWYVSKRIVSLHGERGVGHALSLNQSTHTNLTLKSYKATWERLLLPWLLCATLVKRYPQAAGTRLPQRR